PPRIAVMLDLETGYWRHTSMYVGLQNYAQDQGWETTIDEYADDTLPARRTKSIPYDGVIARASKKLADRAGRLGVPVVNVWLNSPAQKTLPGVFPDFAAIGRLRAEHLLARGFFRFACLTTNTIAHNLEWRSFSATLKAAGFSCPVAMVPLAPSKTLAQWRKTEQVIVAAMKNWQPPTGLYVAAEDVGRIVAQMCRSHGLRIPEDIAIITGWNEETICLQPRPSLTSVELGGERIGYEAARLLHQLMDGEKPPTKTILLPPKGLVVRESTDFFAVEDELVAAALEYIAANCHRRIGPDKVAKAVGAETRTLQLRFRKHLDRPIATEIRRVRIERAKRELTQSKRPLSDIARDVGFGEAMRMYEVFRRELGVTPSEYRKQRQVQVDM
ncbi:MAG: LacI family transcriptional regulator, partial [Pirellulaceae bacterium]